MIKRALLIMLTCMAAGCSANRCTPAPNITEINIIPKPVQSTVDKGTFRIDGRTKICVSQDSSEAKEAAKYLARLIAVSPQIRQSGDAGFNTITFRLEDREDLGSEGYMLSVRPDAITITASQPAGLFYAVQTLRQLLPPEIEAAKVKAPLLVPCLEIHDRPAFPWRGLLLDCSRTFLEKEYLLRYIDRLALYKMNVLHLHLTDDQGWRVDIRKYPDLKRISSRFADRYPGEKSGCYSQDDIREIVEYAKQRYVTIVPEIEMPGHSGAIFAAYPHLCCRGRATEVFPFGKGPNIHQEILCAGNEDAYVFLEDVLTEVIEMFPSEYIHIGGDEAPKDRWKQCAKCQSMIARHNLKDEEQLQAYFTQRIERFLNSKGRKLIGWDEILEGGLAENAAVMSWRGTQGGIAAAQMNHYVVMSPTSHCYFDYDVKQTPLKETYSFNPIPVGLPADKTRFILGGQGNMWTHLARTEPAIDSQVFPRLIGLAEALWTPQNLKGFDEFHSRLRAHYGRLDIMHVNYGPEQ